MIVYKDENLKPVKWTVWSVCYDLKSSEDCVINPWEIKTIQLGIKTDFGWKMYWRSSLPKKWLMFAIWVWIIDEDYRWEVMATLYNITNKPVEIKKYDRITQAEFLSNDTMICDEDMFDNFEKYFPTERWTWWVGSTDLINKKQ